MARCTLDLTNPYFQNELKSWGDASGVKEALETAKQKIEEEHTSCHRAVQKFFGNHKYTHLHNKVWKYDWSPEGVSAAGRKSWRMIAIVPDPDASPLRVIAAAIYSKSSRESLSLAELASIFTGVIRASAAQDTDSASETEEDRFHRVPNGDGATRSVCALCLEWFFVHTDPDEIKAAEAAHDCPAARAEPT